MSTISKEFLDHLSQSRLLSKKQHVLLDARYVRALRNLQITKLHKISKQEISNAEAALLETFGVPNLKKLEEKLEMLNLSWDANRNDASLVVPPNGNGNADTSDTPSSTSEDEDHPVDQDDLADSPETDYDDQDEDSDDTDDHQGDMESEVFEDNPRETEEEDGIEEDGYAEIEWTCSKTLPPKLYLPSKMYPERFLSDLLKENGIDMATDERGRVFAARFRDGLANRDIAIELSLDNLKAPFESIFRMFDVTTSVALEEVVHSHYLEWRASPLPRNPRIMEREYIFVRNPRKKNETVPTKTSPAPKRTRVFEPPHPGIAYNPRFSNHKDGRIFCPRLLFPETFVEDLYMKFFTRLGGAFSEETYELILKLRLVHGYSNSHIQADVRYRYEDGVAVPFQNLHRRLKVKTAKAFEERVVELYAGWYSADPAEVGENNVSPPPSPGSNIPPPLENEDVVESSLGSGDISERPDPDRDFVGWLGWLSRRLNGRSEQETLTPRQVLDELEANIAEGLINYLLSSDRDLKQVLKDIHVTLSY